ncbi:DUF4873 domain-containing protein [Rhodococcus aetherivorans]|uniref:DUF4873 domain-containing protein n=1 Tax=Rhodococcus aetherivorans TaxID=191292 RepID=UPI00163A70CB|nr:DUF4873 domain-containing protein [Rhodococcus aetherivorans]MBC2588782.1 DUF4873 domain-containing protein [Rhodococcus aetherivorans]
MSDPHDDEPDGYRGPAEVTVGEQHATTEVQLAGAFDPISGRYRWRGRIRGLAAALPPGTDLSPGTDLHLTVPGPGGPAPATVRISETDLWGSHMVDGVSAPPYPTRPHDTELEPG